MAPARRSPPPRARGPQEMVLLEEQRRAAHAEGQAQRSTSAQLLGAISIKPSLETSCMWVSLSRGGRSAGLARPGNGMGWDGGASHPVPLLPRVGGPSACKACMSTAARSKVEVKKLRSRPGPLGSRLPDARSAAHLTPPSAPTPGGVEVDAGGSTSGPSSGGFKFFTRMKP